MERKIDGEIYLQAKENYVSCNSSFPFFECDSSHCFYKYPLKLLLPSSVSESTCQWIYPVIFGGGLVEGDNVNLKIEVQSRCSALLASLSFSKVYCCENGLDSQQHMVFNVHSHALLCVLPDPVVCFKNACYVQTQTFHLQPDSNVVALDWFTSGRYERGERWDFTKLKSSSLFFVKDELVFKEALCLQDTPFLTVKKSMKNYNVCGTCLIIGPFLSFLVCSVLKLLGQGIGYGQKYDVKSLFSVSPLILPSNSEPVGCIIRFAAESVSQVSQKLDELLEPLFLLIGGNPLRNK